MGRTRQREARQFHINNIKKGAEKRADDDFKDYLKKKTGITISDSTAKDIVGIGKAANKMSGEIVNSKIREIKKDVMNSASNGERSTTLMNFVGVSKIGYTLLVNSGTNISNRENFLKDLKDVPDSVFSKSNIEELNKTLINNKVITPENKLKIDNGNVYGSLKKMEKKLDLYARQTLKANLPNDPKKLIAKLAEARKAGNTELVNVLEAKIAILDSTRGKHSNIKKPQKVFGSMRRMASMNIQDPTFQGANALVYYKTVTKTLVKTSTTYYKGLAKGIIKTGDFTLSGTAKVLNKVGLQGASKGVMAVRNTVANVGNGTYYRNAMTKLINPPDKGLKGAVGNFIIDPVRGTKNIKMNMRNTMEKLPGNALHGARVVGSATSKVVVRGATIVGNAIGQTNAYKVVAGTASKAYSKVANSTLGKAAGRIGRAGGRFAGKLFRGGKKLTGIVTKPFKVLGSTILKGFNVVNVILRKILMGVAGVAASLAIFSTVVVLLIVSLTAIGDAVSTSLEKFKTETTMGATYEKLLEKEREFNAAVANLVNEPVPTGEEYNGITQWTNYNIHYIGADGKEMYGSYAYDTGTAMSGANGAEYIINGTSDAIWTFYKKLGWNEYAIAGLMGNIMNECSMNPGLSSEVDAGIVQWTGPRRTKFMNWANANGGWNNLEVQMRYLMIEEGYQSYINTFAHTNWPSVDAATWDFISKYEKYDGWNYQGEVNEKGRGGYREKRERIGAAKGYYDYYTNDSSFADIEKDEDLIADIGSIQGGTSGDTEIAIAATSAYGSSTIKGILSMAAVYIDQDFKKYGAYTDGVFADSVYKDYCAKLYDSTHIIGKDTTPPQVYYCPAYSAESATDKPHAATQSCNNKIPGGSSDTDWLNSGTGINRKFSLSMKKVKDTYTHEDSEGNDDEIPYERYEILETGPHGSVSFRYDFDDEDRAKRGTEALNELKETGCKRSVKKLISRDDDGADYIYVCYCDECKGHIDGNAYVFISNIYDPTEGNTTNSSVEGEEEENESDGEDTDAEDTDDDTDDSTGTTPSTSGSSDAFDNVDKEDAESRFSMYALDKYATAFDAPSGSNVIGTAICPNTSCQSNVNDEYSGYSISVVLDDDGNPVCSLCDTEIDNYTEIKRGREGDAESVEQANATENRAAEKAIMEDLTGKPIEIKEWWKNENWFTNTFSTTKTYYRLYSGEESFDILQKPESDAEDQNIINASNSTPYWFNAFTSSSGRNVDFEKHGWDNDSITLVRLLMAGDWLDLYGIKDFGGITGAPLTDEQLAQLIANSPEWKDLCSDRKAIMYTAQAFQENVAKRFNTQYVYGGGHGPIKTLSQITSADTFDCSSYVSTILYNAGVYYGGVLSTGEFVSSPQFEVISYADLKPGDILVKGGTHVVLYMGGGNISHASTSGVALKDSYNVPLLQNYIKQGFTAMRLRNIQENVYDIEY